MINSGTVLQNRYRIQKQIGQGGMGAVYIATDERFGSTVAIKETFFSEAGFGKAFEREARLLNNLRHPALPRVSDHFIDDEGQFLVMEYIAGEDLSEMLEKKSGAFPLNDVLNWADQLLDAIDYLHTQEMPVIHRDIKPQNLKMTPRGQIILLDFGLAKGNPTDAQHQTAAKSVFGFSRNYASIEQIQGTGTDPRSDLYSLSATLYHLLTGIPPVDALTRAMQVLNGDPDPLKPANEVHPQVPVSVAEVLQRAMDLNSNNRPTSAVAMRTMLRESEKVVSTAIPKPVGATDILTQNTQVFADAKPNQTFQAGAKTDLLSSENSKFIGEDETSLKTRKEEKTRNIQIPVNQKTATAVQSPAANTETGNSKKGMAVGAAALGGILLVGGALGGFYFLKPSANNGTVSNSNISISQNTVSNQTDSNQIVAETVANSANGNINTNANSAAPVLTKKETSEKPTDKTNSEASTSKTSAEPKETGKETVKAETPNTKNEPKVIITDEDGDKIYADGTVKDKDGTTVHPDGRITRNGKVIFSPPPPNVQQPGQNPPPTGMPPLTREQLDQLSPAQRRRIKQIIDNQRRKGNLPPQPERPNQ